MKLTKEEAVRFLRDVIEVPDSVLSEQQPSLSFLNEVIKSYQNVVPWQSVVSCAVPHSQRRLPTWEDIKRNQFAKIGGRCFENNQFMKELLNAFNFDVCFTPAHVWDPNDHLTVMVRGLTGRSSRHWVDVGSTFPLFQAIPFDFETEFVEYDISFLRQRFVKMNGVIEWLHSRHHLPYDGAKVTKDGKWYKCAKIMADTVCDVKDFEPQMTIRYTVQEDSMFLREARSVVYKKDRLIAIKGTKLVMETDDKTVERKQMESVDEVVEAYKTYFPQIPTDIVQDALQNTKAF